MATRMQGAGTPVKWKVIVCCALALRVLQAAGAESDIQESEVVIEAESSLVLFDVFVSQADGSPLPGLSAEDFRLLLSGKPWPIVAVDDYCLATVDSNLPADLSTDTREPTRQAPAPPPGEVEDPISFVIYMDDSQLTLQGRGRATDAAIGWLEQSKPPGARVMLVANGPTGMELLSPMTEDTDKLIHLLRAAYEDPGFIDVFPSQRQRRLDECNACRSRCPTVNDCGCRICIAHANAELHHARISASSFHAVVEMLHGLPGRKVLLLFHDTGVLLPHRLFGVWTSADGDQLAKLDAIAASATESRTTLYTANVGSSMTEDSLFVTNLGANYGDLTGGRHNRSYDDVDDFLASIGRDSCLYRVAIRPPGRRSDRVYYARIQAPGRVEPQVIRVRFLSEQERWQRRARDVLLYPETGTDLPVTLALVPHGKKGKRWIVDVELSFPAASLFWQPCEGRRCADFGAGLVVLRDDDDLIEQWERFAQLRTRRGQASRGVVRLHGRLALRAGHYTLRAYVGDVPGRTFGGARLSLPLDSGADDLILLGPFFEAAGSSTRVLSFEGEKDDPSRNESARGNGRTAAMRTFLCSTGEAKYSCTTLRQFQVGEQALPSRVSESAIRAGTCTAFRDELPSTPAGGPISDTRLTFLAGCSSEQGNEKVLEGSAGTGFAKGVSR